MGIINMRTFFAAAFVATATASDMTTEQLIEYVNGFLDGIGASEDVHDCFNDDVGTELEDVMELFIQNDDCKVDGLEISQIWGLGTCLADLANLTKDIGDGLLKCASFDMTSDDE